MKGFKLTENHKGPIIGIMTGKGKGQSLAGNGPLFIELQKELIKSGGISVVFTPESLKENEMEGFIFSVEENKWFPTTSPLPHIVYNRVPFRKHEKSHSFQKALQYFKEKQIPYFNPCFLDKYEIYQMLKDHPQLSPFLPETILAKEKNMLQELLNKYKKLYLKPSHGSQGKGICRISILPDHSIEQAALEKTIHYPSFEEFWNKWEPTLMQKSYLAQEAIIPAILNGKRYDFRILAHYTHEGYKVTGVGIRQSETQEITTHIPNGGKLIPYEQVQTVKHDQFIEKAVKEIGRHLTAKMSFFGEFSIDAGVSDQGKYVIYEINSKPMSFDEKEIEYRRIQTLGRLFFEMSGF